MSKTPVINQRYESAEQLRRFKKAAKVYRWSLNTFMNVAGQELAERVLAEEKQSKVREQQEKKIKEEVKMAIAKQILQEDKNAENSTSYRSSPEPTTNC